MCGEKNEASGTEVVRDFTVTGFEATGTSVAAAHAQVKDLLALNLKVCVGASYNPQTNKICFSIPIYGDLCVTSPVHVPLGASFKVCAETCGSIIPTGLKVTIYMNNNPIFSGTIVGFC